ncbi:hypothetical protein DDW13_05230 [Acidianus hospitalis]|uniref:Uncharacterized protein n=1 Tax=Acidianus hospitalis TaxID=563177 RepID=A0A2T9X584_9CREN|nr:hypothetical protein DDW13_05230 [Acidianus hospitalis]
MDTGKVERTINVHSTMYAFLALISIILLAIFPIGIDIGAAILYFAGASATTITTTATVAGVFFGGAAATAGVANLVKCDCLLYTALLITAVALLATGIGFA